MSIDEIYFLVSLISKWFIFFLDGDNAVEFFSEIYKPVFHSLMIYNVYSDSHNNYYDETQTIHCIQ